MQSLAAVRPMKMFAAAGVLLLGACSGFGQPAAPPKSLHIGVDLPLSGAEEAAARPALNGIRFFVQQHPRIGDFAVSLVVADDTSGGVPNGSQGVTNVRKFLDDSALIAMIGPLNASVARKEIPVANEANLAMVSPATSNPCLTRDLFLPAQLNPSRAAVSCKDAGLPAGSDLRPTHLNNYFRLATTDDLQGPAAADYLNKTLHLLRVAVISDHEVYGQGLAASFTARLQNLGGTVVGRLDVDPKKTADVPGFLKAMKQAGAQAVYYGGASRDHGCAIRADMKAIFESGYATPFISGDGVAYDPRCIKDADGNVSGLYATVPFVDATARPEAAQAIAAFKSAFGNVSDYGPYTMPAYDATAVLYAALERAVRSSGYGIPDRGNVISQLSVTSGFSGATGMIGFDRAGDTTNRFVSVVEPTGADERAPWRLVSAVDYRANLPY